MSAVLDRATAAWGDAMPPWVGVLAAACDLSSQNKVAGKLGYSAATVSNVLAAKYPGDLRAVERAVRGALMDQTVECPVVGQLSTQACGEHQKAKWAPHNPQRIQFYRACRAGCPHSQLSKTEGAR